MLGLRGDGLSVPAIAVWMCISQSTATTYVAPLYEKLGAGMRVNSTGRWRMFPAMPLA
jgi:DNA-binding NarL/FixJ family response regulator